MTQTKSDNQSYLVFNGDADGIFAAHQLRNKITREPKLITGVKRDISLLKKIETETNAEIFVCDIAVSKNLPELKSLLDQNCRVKWFDHHISKEIPEHPNLEVYIETTSNVNSSLMANRYSSSKTSLWTIAGLFGDNLREAANQVAKEMELQQSIIDQLQELGELFNYNAYGNDADDLYFHPAELLSVIASYGNPLDFIQDSPVLKTLRKGRAEDLRKAEGAEKIADNIVLFPDEKWARRVIGDFANQLAQQETEQAHAVLVAKGEEEFVVSVRAALKGSKSAAEFCQLFPTGGGRVKAAGINSLQRQQLDDFQERFQTFFSEREGK